VVGGRGSGLGALDFRGVTAHFSWSVNLWKTGTMYAIIRTGDKQFRAEPGMTLRIPSLDAEVGDQVTFDEVLVAASDSGVAVGTPTVEGAQVVGEVIGHGRAKKVIIFKWKRRKNYRRKKGHRQGFTEVRISEIRAG
jgi:large subunit ribosomal protein L21